MPKEVAENEADTDLFSQEGEELEDRTLKGSRVLCRSTGLRVKSIRFQWRSFKGIHKGSIGSL